MVTAKFSALFRSEHLILWFCILLAGFSTAVVPGFATWWNAQTILLYAMPLLMASVGLTFVLITGGIDLSITSIMAAASVAGAMIMSTDSGLLANTSTGIPIAILVMIGVGCALGALNGHFVSNYKIPSFIATLTLMMFVSGLAVWSTRSEKIGGLPTPFLDVGQNLILMAGLVAVLVIGAHWVLSRTLYGRWLYAVGLNEKAALVSGVPVRRTIFFVYVISGGFAAIASILLTANLETGDPVMARNSLLDIVGATVLGGASLQGGRGKVLWTLYGVTFLVLLDNILNLMNVNYYFITMSKGAVILAAASLDALRHR